MTLDMDLVIMSDKKGITAQKMKFSIKDFFSKCDQIRSKLRIWSHLLKKSLVESFIFCAVNVMMSGNVAFHVFAHGSNNDA